MEGVADPLEIWFSCTCVTVLKSVILDHPYERNYGGLSKKIDPLRLAFQGYVLKVIGTDMDRSATYE